MKEHPILFNGPMVRAILEGRKTQTRRVVKPQPNKNILVNRIYDTWNCPYGAPGDRLWVRETILTSSDETMLYASGKCRFYPPNEEARKWLWKRKINTTIPSIHMPRWASRILLEVVEVRVERVQEISPADAIAESCDVSTHSMPTFWFKNLWDSINAKKSFSWFQDPWVWVVTFKVIL